MMTYENIVFEVKSGIGSITINRPESLNSLNSKVFDELEIVLQEIRTNDSIETVIITGAGKAFVAGADISLMSSLSPMEGRTWTMRGQKVFCELEAIEKPVIAAVNGYALGGGCELAMACDIIFASDKAKFGQPEVNLGIIPGYGGTQRLPRIVGEKNAKYLIYSGEIIDADEAYRMGLVQKVYPAETLLEEAEKFASKMMTKAPIGLKMSKVAIRNGLNVDLRTGIAIEAEAYAGAFTSEDRIEGMKAFLEKRKPSFKNK
jgi:Enoyl-CoA hydratase/carnithine racemase